MSVERRTLRLPRRAVEPGALGYFRWTELGGDTVVLTNDAGEFEVVPSATFTDLLAGRIDDAHPAFRPLQAKGFLRQDLDLAEMARRIREHLVTQLANLKQMPLDEMLEKRYQRLLSYGN